MKSYLLGAKTLFRICLGVALQSTAIYADEQVKDKINTRRSIKSSIFSMI